MADEGVEGQASGQAEPVGAAELLREDARREGCTDDEVDPAVSVEVGHRGHIGPEGASRAAGTGARVLERVDEGLRGGRRRERDQQ